MILKTLKKKFSNAPKGLNHVRKFYKEVNIEPLETKEGHFKVLLDSRKLRTPDGHLFSIPSKPLAYLVAKEFELQKDYIRTSSMPLVN